MATHSSVLAWRIPGTEEPGGLPSMGSHRLGHDWRDLAAAAEEAVYLRGNPSKHQWESGRSESEKGKQLKEVFVIKLVLPRGSWTVILLDGLGVNEGHASDTAYPRGKKGAGVFKHQPVSDGLKPLGPDVRVGRGGSGSRDTVLATGIWTGMH